MKLRWLALGAFALVGCNAIFGIEGATLLNDGETPTGGDAGDGGDGGGPSSGDAGEGGSATDGPVEGSSEGGVDGGPWGCAAEPIVEVSQQATTGNFGPSLAYDAMSGLWGLAWNHAGGTVHYNAVATDGGVVNASDPVVVPASAGKTYAQYPRLEAAEGKFALGYSVLNGTSAQPALRMLNSSNGNCLGGTCEALGTVVTVAGSPGLDIGGIARANSSGIMLTGRPFSLNAGTSSNTSLFTETPAYTQVTPPTSASFYASVGWAKTSGVFGVASNEKGSPNVGKLTRFTYSPLSFVGTTDFTTAADRPAAEFTWDQVSIAASGDRFFIVWVSMNTNGNREIRVVATSASNGNIIGQSVIASDTTNVSRAFPRIVFDGTSVAVAWVEADAGSFKILFRRYDKDLNALPSIETEPRCVTCGTGSSDVSQVPFGLAVRKENEYGIAYLEKTEDRQLLARLTCSGP